MVRAGAGRGAGAGAGTPRATSWMEHGASGHLHPRATAPLSRPRHSPGHGCGDRDSHRDKDGHGDSHRDGKGDRDGHRDGHWKSHRDSKGDGGGHGDSHGCGDADGDGHRDAASITPRAQLPTTLCTQRHAQGPGHPNHCVSEGCI